MVFPFGRGRKESVVKTGEKILTCLICNQFGGTFDVKTMTFRFL
jgi:hypothetical protein